MTYIGVPKKVTVEPRPIRLPEIEPTWVPETEPIKRPNKVPLPEKVPVKVGTRNFSFISIPGAYEGSDFLQSGLMQASGSTCEACEVSPGAVLVARSRKEQPVLLCEPCFKRASKALPKSGLSIVDRL